MRTKVAVALVILAFLFGAGIAGSIGWVWLHRQSGPQIGNTATIIKQVQSLSDLVTVKFVMQRVVIFTNSSSTTLGNLPTVMHLPGFDEDRIMLMAHGVVKAGVNLGRIGAADVDTSGRAISVKLPPAVVTDAYLDEAQTQVLDRKAGLLRPFERSLEQQARQYARLEMTRAARQSGIEKEAEQRAHEQLKRLFESMGYTNVTFRK